MTRAFTELNRGLSHTMLAYLLVLLLVSSARGSFQSFVLGYDEHCSYTREDAIKCFAKYVDTNKDGVISLDELENAQTKYVGIVLRMMKWVVSWIADTSTPTILRDCDYNKVTHLRRSF